MDYKTMTIAGFDGSGGAGMQADLKTFSALGCYGTTVLTSLPIQNTQGVQEIYDIPLSCIRAQIKSVLDDISIDSIKIGMLHKKEIIDLVAETLSHYPIKSLVLDPVMVAKSGHFLLEPDAIKAMKEKLFPLVTVLTPNLLEASALLGREILTQNEMSQAALDLLAMGPQAVVVKGGHLQGDCHDCLAIKHPNTEIHWFTAPRTNTRNTHGTGCTFSAAIASFLARGFSIKEAVANGKIYLTKAVEAGACAKIGKGNGPVHHFHQLWECL